jgi:tetratricopeptide (TPR) repeat protein
MKNDDSPEIEELVERGQFREALASVDKLIHEGDPRAKLWADKGWILYRMENYASAVEAFTQALALRPRAATTLFFRAQCREKLGDLVGALKDYHASFEIKPQSDAMLNIGLIFRYRQEHDAARSAFTTALQLDPACEVARELMQEPDSPPQAPRG